jgi:hypothetical protein
MTASADRADRRRSHQASLGAAMIEQARLGDAFERAVGTSSEQAAYQRLRRSGRNVSACDQRVREDLKQPS